MSFELRKEFHCQDKIISYTLRKNSRARRMRLTVHYDGRVVVTIPTRATVRGAERFIHEKKEWLLKQVNEYIRNAPTYSHAEHDFRRHRLDALNMVTEKLQLFNITYQYTYNRVHVKDHKSQWGSCSTKKNLNFNYRILFLPDKLRDYIVVHELCHLGESNHSKAFWKLVAQTIPEYKKRRRELRQRYFV
jgi:predicted metal-dependent hydrolase